MTILTRVFRCLFSVYGFLTFIFLMLLLLPLFGYSFLRGKIKGGNFLYSVCRFWADAFFFLIGIRHANLYEEDHDPSRQYIFVSNHISYLDIPMMMKAIRGQHVRILGKAEMAGIPVFGFIYKQGTVLVSRGSLKERSNSVQNLIYFLSRRISVFICPEGTFNVTHQPLKSFYDGAFRIAIETQKPIRPVLFLDTYDRLNYKTIFSLNPGRCRAVFLPATDTTGLQLADVKSLKDKIYRQMEESLTRYEASWIDNK